MSELTKAETAVGGVITTVAGSSIGLYLELALACIVLCALSFGVGYLYRDHVDEVKQAGTTATVKTADAVASATVATADAGIATHLQSKLASANARAASLQTQIEAARNANPPAADCRLPDGLRNELSADLTTGTGQVQDPVQ
jgi:hypothetical protein